MSQVLRLGQRGGVDVLKLLRRHSLQDFVARRRRKFPLLLFPGFMSTRMVAWQAKACTGLDIGVLDQVGWPIGNDVTNLISFS